MTVWFLFAFVVTNVILDLAPGSAVERVVGEAMGRGVARAHAAILGVLAADLVWATVAIGWLWLIMDGVPILLYMAKWLGLAALVHLLGRALRIAVVGRGVHEVAPRRDGGLLAAAGSAFVLQMRHPARIFFFMAVVSVFTGSRIGWEGRLVDLGLMAVALEWPIFALYAFCAATAAGAMARIGAKTCREALAAILLLTATGYVAVPSAENR